jgi:1D-myo-inositol 3-kinase
VRKIVEQKAKMEARMLDILFTGHCTHDIIIQKDRQFLRLGGSPSYISRLLESLNRAVRSKEKESHDQLNYTMISKVGPDFKYFSKFLQKPIPVTKPTTCFINRYHSSEKVQEVRSICEPIFPKDIQSKSKVGLIAGVIGEVLPETIEKLSSLCQVIFCDAQGLIRKVNRLGRVYHVDLTSTEFYDVLSKINFLQLNKLESQFVKVKEISRKTIVLLTKGKDGCSIIERGKEFKVSTRPLPEKDPTGAGDLFLVGFAYAILRRYSLEKCAQVANYFGGLAVGSVGIPTKIKIRESFV